MNLLKWFGHKSEETLFKVDVPEWHDGNETNLRTFLKTPDGELFIQHLKKYMIEVNQWATDVSMESYDNMKYRACVAHGVKLCFDKIMAMSRAKPESKYKKPDEKDMDKFFSSRMGLFKS